MNIRIKRFNKKFPLPARQDPEGERHAAGIDFVSRETVTIKPHTIKAVPQNAAIRVPDGHVLLLFARSSTALRKGLMLSNGVGVVDPFYCGNNDEVLAFMYNMTDEPVTVEAGDRIIQGMFLKPVEATWEEVDDMNSTGHNGYQHTDNLTFLS